MDNYTSTIVGMHDRYRQEGLKDQATILEAQRADVLLAAGVVDCTLHDLVVKSHRTEFHVGYDEILSGRTARDNGGLSGPR